VANKSKDIPKGQKGTKGSRFRLQREELRKNPPGTFLQRRRRIGKSQGLKAKIKKRPRKQKREV